MIFIGDVVNTHGIKGEIRILSDFKYKDIVFKEGNFLYIGDDYLKYEIRSHRIHKGYDMVKLVGIEDITDALPFKTEKVYINRLEYQFPGVLDEDVIGLTVYGEDKEELGVVETILKTEAHGIIVIKNKEKKYLVPYIDEFVKEICLDEKRITIHVIEGLLDEN